MQRVIASEEQLVIDLNDAECSEIANRQERRAGEILG